MEAPIATRRWTLDDQRRFAAASGDRNPLHLDALVARRTAAGACAVHGMHLVLWALDTFAARGMLLGAIGSLRVAFRSFVRIDDQATLHVVRGDARALRAAIVVDGAPAVSIDLRYGSADAARPAGHDVPRDVPALPADLDLHDIAGLHGSVIVAESPDDAAHLFVAAAAAIGAQRVAALARLSAIVGMLVPGRHSIFASLELGWTTPARARIDYEAVAVDARFALVEIRVDGGGIAGTIGALRRPSPVAAPRRADVARLVRPDEFAGTTSLIVGGSRGLGAVTATALAAGGGRVVLTYALGAADAATLVAELGAVHTRAVRYDVREPAAPQLAAIDEGIDRLYYFASPIIYRPRGGPFDAARFHALCRTYVDGLADVIGALRQRSAAPLGVFYPSTAFADDPPRELVEYALAKIAGEGLCAHLSRVDPGLRTIVARLPRLATDQNAGLIGGIGVAPALETLLPYVRAMHAAASPP